MNEVSRSGTDAAARFGATRKLLLQSSSRKGEHTMADKLIPMPCTSCDEGNEPHLLDIDGVRCSVSGTPGCWGHAYEDDWWPCQRKAAEEHAIIDKLPKDADGDPVEDGKSYFFRCANGALEFVAYLSPQPEGLSPYPWNKGHKTAEAAIGTEKE